MKRLVAAAVLALLTSAWTLAQPPELLPPTVLDPVALKPAGPLSPAEAAKERAATIKALKEDVRTFDPYAVRAHQTEGRWQVRAGAEVLKDFGADRAAATEAARLIHDLRVNQVGTIPGARPDFQYWLTDGKAPRGSNARLVVVPVSARSVSAEMVGGTWIVTDGAKGLYDFGTDAEAARRAATVFWKYGFNQLGLVGGPQPALLCPLMDPRQTAQDKVTPLSPPSPLAVLEDAGRTSLLLPGNVYAGPKTALDLTKLVAARRGEWVLAYGDMVLGRFGSNEQAARGAIKALQDARPTEVVRLGDGGFPLFLANGQPIHGEPLGGSKTSIRTGRLKVQKVRETWWLFEDTRPLMEAGLKTDAELLLLVVRFYDLKTVCLFGRPDAGLRLFTAGR
jgi:hypothetical protein